MCAGFAPKEHPVCRILRTKMSAPIGATGKALQETPMESVCYHHSYFYKQDAPMERGMQCDGLLCS